MANRSGDVAVRASALLLVNASSIPFEFLKDMITKSYCKLGFGPILSVENFFFWRSLIFWVEIHSHSQKFKNDPMIQKSKSYR